MNNPFNRRVTESLKTNQYQYIQPQKEDEKNFSCPEYLRKKSGEKRDPTMGDPCMFCAHPSCPLHTKVIM